MDSGKVVGNTLMNIDNDSKNKIEIYVSNVLTRDFLSFETENDLMNFFHNYLEIFYQRYTRTNLIDLRMYTGPDIKNINAILRDNWTYSNNGVYTYAKKNDLIKYAHNLSNLIDRQDYIWEDLKAFQAYPLSVFNEYKINNIEDLMSLKGEYLYDKGFSYLSLFKDPFFYNSQNEYRNPCNIEIEYLIPKESIEVIINITKNMYYNIMQGYLLINSGSLYKVIDVKIDSNSEKAYMKVAFIPRKIYDKDRTIEFENKRKLIRR